MIKDYENNSLRKYFEKWVGKLKVSKEFKPIIVDILLRRSKEFELSGEDIKQDMTSLLYNLKAIKVVNFPEKYSNIAGMYIPDRETILISKKCVLERDKEELYEILTHELFHAVTFDEHGEDRLESLNRYTKEYNVSLLEAIVEKAAHRCVYPANSSHKPYLNQNKVGYTDITFITDAIGAVYGVTEKEFLKNGIMGRDRLAKFLSEKAGESEDETLEFLDEIEVNYAMLHNTLYLNDGRRLARKEKEHNVMIAMTGILRSCEKKMCERIENIPVNGLRQSKNFMKEMEFNHNKLLYSIEYAINLIENTRHIKIFEQVEDGAEKHVLETMKRINDVNSVLEAYIYNLTSEQRTNFLNMAKIGILHRVGKENLLKFGIHLTKQKVFLQARDVVQRYIEDDFSEDKWDNSKITRYTKSVLEKRGKITILDKTKQKLDSFKEKFVKSKKFNYKKPKPKKQVYKKVKIEKNSLALSKEELKEFNEKADKVLKEEKVGEKRNIDTKEEEKD